MNQKIQEVIENGTGILVLNRKVTGVLLTETKGGNDMIIVNLAGNQKIFAFDGDGTFEHVEKLRAGDIVTGIAGDVSSSMNPRGGGETSSGGEVQEKQLIFTQFEILAINEGTFGQKIEGVSDTFYARPALQKRAKKEQSGKTYGEKPATKPAPETVDPDANF